MSEISSEGAFVEEPNDSVEEYLRACAAELRMARAELLGAEMPEEDDWSVIPVFSEREPYGNNKNFDKASIKFIEAILGCSLPYDDVVRHLQEEGLCLNAKTEQEYLDRLGISLGDVIVYTRGSRTVSEIRMKLMSVSEQGRQPDIRPYAVITSKGRYGIFTQTMGLNPDGRCALLNRDPEITIIHVASAMTDDHAVSQ